MEGVLPAAVSQSTDGQALGSGVTLKIRQQDPNFAIPEEIDATRLSKRYSL